MEKELNQLLDEVKETLQGTADKYDQELHDAKEELDELRKKIKYLEALVAQRQQFLMEIGKKQGNIEKLGERLIKNFK